MHLVMDGPLPAPQPGGVAACAQCLAAVAAAAPGAWCRQGECSYFLCQECHVSHADQWTGGDGRARGTLPWWTRAHCVATRAELQPNNKHEGLRVAQAGPPGGGLAPGTQEAMGGKGAWQTMQGDSPCDREGGMPQEARQPAGAQ